MNSFRFRLAGLAMATSAMAFSVPALADGYLSGPRAAGCCFSWTGFYIGVNAGGAWSDFGNSLAVTNATPAYFNPLVISAVKRLGYVPDAHARHLASRDRHRTLGIIVSDIENPFFPEVIKGFETRARELGYDAILSDTNYDLRRTQEAANRMVQHKVRGVAIMTSEISLRLIGDLARRKIAVTFLDLAPVREYMSNLRIDYSSGMQQIVKYLHDCGHRRIAFVAGRPGLKSNVARLQAYENCMRALGLEPGPILPGDLRFEGGLAAGLAIAKLSPRPTAVMAINDLTAVGVIKGLVKSGCRVPQDVSVTGFDNTRLAEYSNPSITTVDIHREVLGQIAADALHELSRSPNPHGKEYQINVELILGDSSGSAPS